MNLGFMEVKFKNPFKKAYSDLAGWGRNSSYNDPKTNPSTQLKEYKSWVSSCVSLISRRVSSVPFKYYKFGTDEEINSRNHSFKNITAPFDVPNQLMTFRFIKSWCQTQLDLCGMAAVLKVKNVFGETRELWPLNMNNFIGAYDSNMSPIETSAEILPKDVFYVFQYGGKQYPLSIKDIILLMYPNPTCMFLGASPVQQQAYAVDAQTYIEIYERDFFGNSARVDMVLATDEELGQDLADQIKDRWLNKFSFSKGGKFHDIAVLEKGVKPIPMKWTNKDFEFLALANWTKEMVLGAYGINPSKLGSGDGVNRSSSVYVDIDFNREVITPRLEIWDDEMTEIAQEVNPNIQVRHENPIPRDRQIEVQESRVYLAGMPSYTINEWRRVKNYPPVKDGDEIYVKKDYVPLSMLKEIARKELQVLLNPPNTGNNNDTDPTRHDDDEPHLNPDGSDDRDSQPTEGRSIESVEIELKEIWTKKLNEYDVIEDAKENITHMIKTSVISVLKYYFNEDNITDKWIDEYSLNLTQEFVKTVGNKYYKHQINTNSRIQKLIHNGVRACLNYCICLVAEKHGYEKEWLVDRNNCSHLGRLKNFKTVDNFMIGNTQVRFPLEKLNLSCDCMLRARKKDNGV